jgi:hypothetical protein
MDASLCPRSGGRLRVVATIQDPAVVRAILAHLKLAPGPYTSSIRKRPGAVDSIS